MFAFFLIFAQNIDCGYTLEKTVQVGKDQENQENQEKAQSEKDSHSKNRGGKKQTNNQVLIP